MVSLSSKVKPSDVSGMVFEDFNNDGEIDFAERVISNVDSFSGGEAGFLG